MKDHKHENEDEYLLAHLQPIYSALGVDIDLHLAQAINEMHNRLGSQETILDLVMKIAFKYRVPWYKLFIYLAFLYGTHWSANHAGQNWYDADLDTPPETTPPTQTNPLTKGTLLC